MLGVFSVCFIFWFLFSDVCLYFVCYMVCVVWREKTLCLGESYKSEMLFGGGGVVGGDDDGCILGGGSVVVGSGGVGGILGSGGGGGVEG